MFIYLVMYNAGGHWAQSAISEYVRILMLQYYMEIVFPLSRSVEGISLKLFFLDVSAELGGGTVLQQGNRLQCFGSLDQ